MTRVCWPLLAWSCTHQSAQPALPPPPAATEVAQLPAPIPAGLAAGDGVLFVGSPLDGRVQVLAAATGAPIAELPQPPTHLVLPLILRASGPHRVAVLDCGGFPSPGKVDASPVLYEYDYALDGDRFTATLTRTIRFDGVPIGFAEELVHLPDGGYLVPDAVYGAIWRVTPEGAVVPGIGPRSHDTADAIPSMAYCPTMEPTTVGGLPFLFTDATIPGVAGIAVRDDTVYFYSSCAAALYALPMAALFDERSPWERASDIRRIGGKPDDVKLEELLELQFDPYTNDPSLYAADALQFQVIRIDPATGRREVVSHDERLFDFPASLSFVPPAQGAPRSLVVLSNQQHRDPNLNPAITEDRTRLPYLLTRVTLPDAGEGLTEQLAVESL
jgi:hypothetical protein